MELCIAVLSKKLWLLFKTIFHVNYLKGEVHMITMKCQLWTFCSFPHTKVNSKKKNDKKYSPFSVTKKFYRNHHFSKNHSLYYEFCDFHVVHGFCVHTFYNKYNILVIVILWTSPLSSVVILILKRK